MGATTKEVGGGAATGLANNFISSLQQLLNNGGVGAAGAPNAAGSTGNIMSVLQGILSPGAGELGNSITSLIGRQNERDVAGLRARFTAGGASSFGSPAAFAESLLRAEAQPRATQAIGGLQLQAIQQLLPLIAGLSDKGIAQRQIIQEQSTLGKIAGVVGPLAGAAANIFAPGIGPVISGLSNFANSSAINTTPNVVGGGIGGGFANQPLRTGSPLPQFSGFFGGN